MGIAILAGGSRQVSIARAEQQQASYLGELFLFPLVLLGLCRTTLLPHAGCCRLLMRLSSEEYSSESSFFC